MSVNVLTKTEVQTCVRLWTETIGPLITSACVYERVCMSDCVCISVCVLETRGVSVCVPHSLWASPSACLACQW